LGQVAGLALDRCRFSRHIGLHGRTASIGIALCHLRRDRDSDSVERRLSRQGVAAGRLDRPRNPSEYVKLVASIEPGLVET
jgi:hypothetical protein